MNTDDLLCVELIILSFISGCMIAALMLLNRVAVWRLRWIELEHDLARETGRAPRNIDSI